jgi:hypothetical protein
LQLCLVPAGVGGTKPRRAIFAPWRRCCSTPTT